MEPDAFVDGIIESVEYQETPRCEDERGWLAELWRIDELSKFMDLQPKMCYLSHTNPGVLRGPHEHVQQTDVFVFLDKFEIFLWENRRGRTKVRWKITTSENAECRLIVPPRVVHAYRCLNPDGGLSINCPNQLYKGYGKRSEVDEIRYENEKEHPFVIW